jgi:beta-galactosidase
LPWAGVQPQVQSNDPQVQARLQTGAGGTYIWIVNPTRTQRSVKISLPTAFQHATELWQEGITPAAVSGKMLTATVEDRGAAVIRLE